MEWRGAWRGESTPISRRVCNINPCRLAILGHLLFIAFPDSALQILRGSVIEPRIKLVNDRTISLDCEQSGVIREPEKMQGPRRKAYQNSGQKKHTEDQQRQLAQSQLGLCSPAVVSGVHFHEGHEPS